MARKALSVYVGRLEHGFKNGFVKDPGVEFYSNWTPGIIAAVPVERNIAAAWRRDWWDNPEHCYTREEHWHMIMNMGFVTCDNAALNKLRSGPLYPNVAGTRTEAYEARCLDIIKGYLDTRRPILPGKGGNTSVPDTDVSYHEDGNEILSATRFCLPREPTGRWRGRRPTLNTRHSQSPRKR